MQLLKWLNRKPVATKFLAVLCVLATEIGFAQQSSPYMAGGMAGQATNPDDSLEPGLLFYLSGDNEYTADFAAGGQVQPNYLRSVSIVPDGAIGSGFEADDDQLMSYWAPGNIYAQRGTLSFFWRSRYPVGPTEFPIFRVGFADHSSWDMVWLRIDYNGSGFDAFVTDIGLARTRVSHYMDEFPREDEWTHIALSWDETEGIRFYVNGKLVEQQSVTGKVYDTGLDQFGPHSRIISPYQVQSAYNFMRGGDLDELRVYDRMLSDENIVGLARGEIPATIPDLKRNLDERRWRDAWWTRHGWNLPNDPPPTLPSSNTSIRKIEIHDAIDIKRWMWKANDGIRETTWPGVYNMSRLPGRYDYFVLPDWDAYSMSGQSIRFHLPDKPWNHVEVWGKAWGQLTYESDYPYDNTFAVRNKQQVKSYHRLKEVNKGGIIRFDNALIEEPIGEFGVYHVEGGTAPSGRVSEVFTLAVAPQEYNNRALEELNAYIQGRYPADERAKMVGLPEGSTGSSDVAVLPEYTHPFIHVMIPYSGQPDVGLDGIEIELPALSVKSTHDGVFPLNIRIKDPLWQMRDLADFSFSVEPDQAHTLWIDTRNRILPEERALYITFAGAGSDFTPELLTGAKVRMIYTSKEEAREEHELDRFTQIRDLYGFTVEERPNTPKLNLYNRFKADSDDILKVNPDHWLTKTYKYAVSRNPEDRPEYEIPESPDDIPEWAFLQIEYLKHFERVITHYIDNRQISNGEFGGGLSDDGDFTNTFPGAAYLGITPQKILESLRLHMEAYYDQDRDSYNASLKQRSLPLTTNGLATIFTDELHAYEDGIQVVGQLQLLDYGNPLHFNRGMEIAKRMLEDITQVNSAGHRHFRSRYYSGTSIAGEDPWQWSVPRSYIVLHTAYLIVRYNGNPKLRQMIIDIADGVLAHNDEKGVYTEIHFGTGEHRGDPDASAVEQLLLAAYEFTGDEKYLTPIPGSVQETREFDHNHLVRRYTEEIKSWGVREYINTEGSAWIDRVYRDNIALQEDRLGGVALTRIRNIFPQHSVSWKFSKPADHESVAIFLSRTSKTNVDVVIYNLEEQPVNAEMTVWDIIPGRWRVRQGLDATGDQKIDSGASERIVELERGEFISLELEPREHTIINLELIDPTETGYWERADLGIGQDDVTIDGNKVTVRVHSLGAISSPGTILELRDAYGELVATGSVPSLEAPLDLIPRWTEVQLRVPEGIDLSSGSVTVDPEHKIKQITRRNTVVSW